MKIELYIEGREVDLDDKVGFAINRELSDIFNPGDIKNDWSKTVSIPNTNKNNEIFGKTFSVIKLVDTISIPNVGINFNPSKKASFELKINDIKLMSGYVKMTDISFDETGLWRYEVNLFGELGVFFSKFEDKTLKEILANTAYSKNSIILGESTLNRLFSHYVQYPYNTGRWKSENLSNKYLLYNTNNYLNRIIPSHMEDDEPNIYIDLIDAENGLYSKGDTVEFHPSRYHLTGVKEEDDERRANYRDADFKNKLDKISVYTEQQLALKDTTKQRFGLYNDMLLLTIINKLGYTLDLETDFFDVNNPYFTRTLVTCPIPLTTSKPPVSFNINYSEYSKTSVNSGVKEKDAYHYFILKPDFTSNAHLTRRYSTTIKSFTDYGINDDYTGDRTGYTLEPNNLQYGGLNKTVEFNLPQDFFYIEFVAGSGDYLIPESSYNIPYLTFKFYDEGKKIAKDLILIGSNTIGKKAEDEESITFGFSLRVTSFATGNRVILTIDSGGYTVADYINENVLKSKSILGYSNSLLAIEVVRGKGTTYFLTDPGTGFHYLRAKEETMSMNVVAKVSYDMDNTIYAEQEVSYIDYLPDLKAVDYFKSYIKLFGLYLVVNENSKTIQLLTRNEFFSGSNTVDWSDKFVDEKDSSLSLLNFKSKYINLSYKKGVDNLNKKYEENYYRYGSYKLNTGYDFNNNAYELFEDIVFQPSISSLMSTDIYGVSGKIIPYYFDGETLDKSKLVNPVALVFKNGYNYDDRINRKLPYNKYPNNDRYFLFTNRSYNSYGTGIYSYNLTMYKDVSTYNNRWKLDLPIVTADLTGPSVSTKRQYMQYSNHYPGIEDPVYSLDIHTPPAIAYPITYNSDGTIYSRFWKKYLGDRYNVNTKVFTGYFYLSYKDVAQFEFNNFIFFRGAIWTVNKIIDYNPESMSPTKVELISVQDINNYINSVNLT